MNKPETIRFPCLEVTQPIGTFYLGVMDHEELLKISYADIARIERREIEEFSGIERPLSAKRKTELQQYVKTIDATFPTSIILSVSQKDANYNPKTGTMTLRRAENIAKILDGQHRIAGLEKYEGTFQVNVTIFVEMDLEDQAMVFGTINLAQTKVSKSLVYQLYEYARSRSPQKTCHNVAKLLNSEPRSPFKDRIKILGTATPGKTEETLTQATFVEALLPYVSDDPTRDRNLLKRGKKLKRADEAKERRVIFVNMFREERDAEIARILWNFFGAVQNRWADVWPKRIPGNILNRTTGFRALMRFLRDAYLSLTDPGAVVSKDKFRKILGRIRLKGRDFNPERFKPGSAGESDLYHEFLAESGLGKRKAF